MAIDSFGNVSVLVNIPLEWCTFIAIDKPPYIRLCAIESPKRVALQVHLSVLDKIFQAHALYTQIGSYQTMIILLTCMEQHSWESNFTRLETNARPNPHKCQRMLSDSYAQCAIMRWGKRKSIFSCTVHRRCLRGCEEEKQKKDTYTKKMYMKLE